MNLGELIDNFGMRIENLGRKISGKNKGVRLEYRKIDNMGHWEVDSVNKYGEVLNTTPLRAIPGDYLRQLGI